MTDVVDKKTRSRMMAGIRGRDTKPERFIRSSLHRLGYRFRLHDASLPGRPDLVLRKHRTVIFVHGCFWHRHHGCRYAYKTKSRQQFWESKLSGNRQRDERQVAELRRLGWRVIIVWECIIRADPRAAQVALISALSGKDELVEIPNEPVRAR